MGFDRFCVVCGTPFNTTDGYRATCSASCSHQREDEGMQSVYEMVEWATPAALKTLGLKSLDQYAEWREILESGYDSPDGEVYFVLCDEYVKIGYSQDPQQRFAELQVGNPQELSLFARFPGSRETEHALHQSFSHSRIRGEWFMATDEIMDFVKRERMRILTKG